MKSCWTPQHRFEWYQLISFFHFEYFDGYIKKSVSHITMTIVGDFIPWPVLLHVALSNIWQDLSFTQWRTDDLLTDWLTTTHMCRHYTQFQTHQMWNSQWHLPCPTTPPIPFHGNMANNSNLSKVKKSELWKRLSEQCLERASPMPKRLSGWFLSGLGCRWLHDYIILKSSSFCGMS